MSAQDVELAQDHLREDAPSAQKMNLRDERANPEYDTKPTAASIHVFSTQDNQSQGEGSQISQQAISTSRLSKNELHDQDLTGKVTNESIFLDVATNISSISCSKPLDTSLQSNLVNENTFLKEELEEKDSASLIQNPPSMKEEAARSQLRNGTSTDDVLGAAENLLLLSEITIPPTPPATALAPSDDPTAAICDGSTETSPIEISVDAANLLSDHNCDPGMPPSDAHEPSPSDASISVQSRSLEELVHGKELTLDELVQGFNHFEDMKEKSITNDESIPSNTPLHPDESLFATSGIQKSEINAFIPNKEQVEEELKDVQPEFMLDSSPIQSSSSDTSSDQSSSDNDDDDDDYEMLDPAEQAARLMQEDIDSDGEGTGRGANGASAGPPRTLNEKPEEVIPKPDLIITEKMKIEELGHVENIVENLVLIKAKTSGEYQVLESGSVLCLEKRIVIGVVAETLGRVEQPYYTVQFTNVQAIAEADISKGTKIFYVEQFSSSVFTQPLKIFKGSDASNLHDEEVGDEGIEFSDDEAEAEHKRKLKLARQTKRDIREGSKDGLSQRGRQRGGKMQKRAGQNHPSQGRSSRIDHDQPEGGDDLYTPLARPPNLHEIMGQNEAPVEDQNLHRWVDRGGRGGRGKGDRGRGRGDKGRGNRGHGGYRGNPGNNTRMGTGRQNLIQSPIGDVGLQPGGSDSLSAPTDAATPYYTAARQPQTGLPVPSVNQPGPQQSAPPSHYGQNNNPYHQLNPQIPFYPAASQTSYPHPQPPPPPPPQYVPPSQTSQFYPPSQSSQYFPPSPHHQSHMPYSQYHPQPPSPSTPNVPAGTFINPAFFPLAAQPTFPQWPQVNSTQQASGSASAGNSQMSPESERAFQAINILRSLASRNESHPHPT